MATGVKFRGNVVWFESQMGGNVKEFLP